MRKKSRTKAVPSRATGAPVTVRLRPSQRQALTIRDQVLPSEWIERHFQLTRSYAATGPVKLFPWQRPIVDTWPTAEMLILIAPTQTGKSMLCEGLLGYSIDHEPSNMMVIYDTNETVQDVFDERLRPLIRETPALRAYWSGDPEDLTKRRMKLLHMVIRVASANTRRTLASHNAGMIYGDEVAKWPQRKGYNPLKLAAGRTHAARMLGRTVRRLFCSSPRIENDYSWQLVHSPGVLYLQPYYECPHCHHWQTLKDAQVKEKPTRKGDHDHDPERIRAEGAAWYECEACHKEITEAERIGMAEGVVWAATDLKSGERTEKISPEGKVIGRLPGARRVAYHWNRLADVTWTFAECLATYFEALHSPDGSTLADYQNEDMARWVKITSRKMAEGYLMKRAKAAKYRQFGTGAYVPEGVLVILVGIDTQDDGFYFVVRGYGKGLESWLLRAEFVTCGMDQGAFVNPAEVHMALMAEIQRYPLQTRDGRKLTIQFGLIDRGGHRSDDVDYICTHSPFLRPYIGSTRKDAPVVELKPSGIYHGNTEQLSRTVEKQMAAEIWRLPADIQPDYCSQVVNQHEQEYTDTRGNTRKRWITGDDTGEPDHYRDCENLLVAAAQVMSLQSMLFDEKGAAALARTQAAAAGPAADAAPPLDPRGAAPDTFLIDGQSGEDWLKGGGWR